MDEKVRLEQEMADIIMGRPTVFRADGRPFYIYPLSLGKVYMLNNLISQMGLRRERLEKMTNLEMLRVAKERREKCIEVVLLLTGKGKDEVFDVDYNDEKRKFFSENLSDEDLASLLLLALTSDRTAIVMENSGIGKEQERLRKVLKVKAKKSKGSLSFGGMTAFGTLIDAACERYGWTKDYVVWGIDYSSLRLLLADKVTTTFLTDEELKEIPLSARSNDSEKVRGTKENMEKIKAMGWK